MIFSRHNKLEKLPSMDDRGQTDSVTTPRWTLPVPLASAAPRREFRRASSQLMTPYGYRY